MWFPRHCWYSSTRSCPKNKTSEHCNQHSWRQCIEEFISWREKTLTVHRRSSKYVFIVQSLFSGGAFSLCWLFFAVVWRVYVYLILKEREENAFEWFWKNRSDARRCLCSTKTSVRVPGVNNVLGWDYCSSDWTSTGSCVTTDWRQK